MARALLNGKVVAESDQTIVIEGNHYFPADSIKKQYFQNSTTTTTCGWKGQASYYHVAVDGQVEKDAAWFYPEPKQAASQIKERIAFWKGVKVESGPTKADQTPEGAAC